MGYKPLWKRPLPYAVVIGLLLCIAALLFGSDLAKMDVAKIPRRASWQITGRVIESLEIHPGDHVADIGAGDGYFTFRFADVVGPSGKVYAVEVSDKLIESLEEKARGEGYSNVVVVKGEYDDPLLPDGQMDLVFLCHAYHHIDNRTQYFDRLRKDLNAMGRVGIVDLSPTSLIRFFAPFGHWTTTAMMRDEMRKAHYKEESSFDFLPGQNFLVFSPDEN